jgi:GH43 family beta-xylosidase
LALAAAIVVQVCPALAQLPTQSEADTFKNPLRPSGADPWVIQRDGFYYYMNTTGRNLTIWQTKDMTDLAHARMKVVWTPKKGKPYSSELWAPELHRLGKKWYIYFAADAGTNSSHRIYVLENRSADPLEGSWKLKGKVHDSSDKWAIDATVFENHGHRYMVWSGWEGDTDGEQRLYISELKKPWKVKSKRVMISEPTYPWERFGGHPDKPWISPVYVNEGPEILERGDRIFLVYSASGCWTDHYELGMLEADANADPLNPASWTKHDHPVFAPNEEAQVFAPGHNGFFTSPDGKEDWIIYHANSHRGDGCGGKRSPRIQKFTWNPDGSPNFGAPVPIDTPLQKPSHQKADSAGNGADQGHM